MTRSLRVFHHFIFTAFFSVAASAQLVSLNPFDIAPPTILSEVKALRAANPKMTSTELVDAANKLLEKQGIAFTFSFDDATCLAIDKSIKGMKNPPAETKSENEAKIGWGRAGYADVTSRRFCEHRMQQMFGHAAGTRIERQGICCFNAGA